MDVSNRIKDQADHLSVYFSLCVPYQGWICWGKEKYGGQIIQCNHIALCRRG